MFLSIDIGGTHTRIATSLDGKTINEKERFHTPQKYDDGIDLIVDKIEEMTKGVIPPLIAVCAASPIDYERGVMIKAPNLPNWSGHSIKKELELRLRTKVILDNDASFAALAEAHLPKRKKYPILAYVTLSTGVGGARIVNGKIDNHSKPFETGHIILDPKGRLWPCGQRGCFESLCSGPAFELTYGVKPENCEDGKIWEEHAKVTAQGLVNVIIMWSPDILVVGGSMIKAGHKFLDPLLHETINDIQIFPAPKIEISKMNDNNGLIGGFIMEKDKF